jgi:hypothetical protein
MADGAAPAALTSKGDRRRSVAAAVSGLLIPTLRSWGRAAATVRVSSLRRPGTTTLIQGGALILSLPLYYFAIRAWEMAGGAIVSSATYIFVLACGTAILVANSGVRTRDLVPRATDLRALVDFGRSAIGGRSGA